MADDQQVRLATILAWLDQRKITTAEAASKVATLHFPPPAHATGTGGRFAQDAAGDVPARPAGGFHEISAAYAAGKLDRNQYEALAKAAAQAMAADHGE